MRTPKITACLKSTPYASGKHAIYIQINFNRKRELVSIDNAVLREDWDDINGKCYGNIIEKKAGCKAQGISPKNEKVDPFAATINTAINQAMNYGASMIRHAAEEAALNGQAELDITASAIKAFIKAKINPGKHIPKKDVAPSNDMNFFDFCDEIISDLEDAGKVGLQKRYQSAANKLKKWGGKNILFSTLNKEYILKFYKHLIKDLGNRSNTAHTTVRMLKTIYRAGRERHEKLAIMPYAFKGVELETGSPQRVEKLTEQDIHKIEQLELTGDEERVRDIFLFCFYAMGMRVRDAIQLNWESIGRNMKDISYIETKTGKPKSFELNDETRAILNKYKHGKSTGFIFYPELEAAKNNAQLLYSMASSRSTVINRILKRIGTKAEVSIGGENMSSHVARHSIAAYFYKETKDITLIKEMLNHESISVTEDYLKRLTPEEFSKKTNAVLSTLRHKKFNPEDK